MRGNFTTGAAPGAIEQRIRDGWHRCDVAGRIDLGCKERLDVLPQRQRMVPAFVWRERRVLPRRADTLTPLASTRGRQMKRMTTHAQIVLALAILTAAPFSASQVLE